MVRSPRERIALRSRVGGLRPSTSSSAVTSALRSSKMAWWLATSGIAFRRRRAIRDKNRKKTIACAAGFHGADRVVRLRQMHTFGSPWDGADRFRPMVRLVRHLPSQPGDGL